MILEKLSESLKYRFDHSIGAYFRKRRFMKYANTFHCSFHKSLRLIHPEHIQLKGYCVIGENSKLICVQNYRHGNINQVFSPKIVIGNNVHANRDFIIQCAGEVEIGDNVLIASNVFVIDFNHGKSPISDSYLENKLEISTVRIGDGCWIGNNVVILPGVSIGEKSIIGAGSVVTKNIPPYTISAGNPATVLKVWNSKTQMWERIHL